MAKLAKPKIPKFTKVKSLKLAKSKWKMPKISKIGGRKIVFKF